ncbi:hypothetical protein [Tsukamurella pseudospumae]|uniref:Uncharacterized protein n=1 Tax=Tsukamurella pseudospumae TaxID=239498 RepID=A0A138AIX1_9ACTN|nr:hypothetical protein [Tsukamurella pseudospumae]KXP00085.1 hypothetical protein AXK61_15955 [Tsukamurella pseudospumae]KXP10344.1 hypothetical protein AXK60_07780 [Tsukamurella pseudospumae]
MAHRRPLGRRALATGLASLGLISMSLVSPIAVGAANALEPCPPGQMPFYNGKNCAMQLCTPPYNPTFPPCTMPLPTPTPTPGITGPSGIPGQPF